MWNSRIVLAFMASCLLFYSISSGDEPNGVRSNLAATADELSRAYSAESEITPSPNSNPATEEIATSNVSPPLPPLPPLPPVGSDNSKPRELTLNRILPAVPEVESELNFEIVLPGPEHESAPIYSVEPWRSQSSQAIFGDTEAMLYKPITTPSTQSHFACGETCRFERRCLSDETCRIVTVYSGFAFMSRAVNFSIKRLAGRAIEASLLA
jgi:hypothetical protein